MNLSKEVKISTALDYASAAVDRPGATIDMQGYEGVLMVVKFGAIAAGAVTSIKVQQDSDPNFGTPADLAGTGLAVAADDDNQIFVIDLVKPKKRYVRIYVDKDAANDTAEMAWYLRYGAHTKPQVNNVANLVTCAIHVSPAEGVA